MKIIKYTGALLIIALLGLNACKSSGSETKTEITKTEMKPVEIKEEKVTYAADSTTMIGYVAYDASSEKKRPVVLIVHEWWGLTDYPRARAKQLAELGYIAMAIDMYGNGAIAENPEIAQKLSMPFYQDPEMAKKRFDAALNKIKSFPMADTSQIAAIGYCFGGAQVINMAKLGENLKGVVSFHGNLVVLPADKNLLKAPILVCHGEADQFVKAAEVDQFKKQMDSIDAVYTFKSYPGATHAFTNPKATETGKKFNMPIEYNAAADTASWNDMKDFFGKVFN